MREYVPSDDATGLRFCIVAAQWNDVIVRRLLEGALATLRARGAADDDIEVRWVPGSLELPWAAIAALSGGGPEGFGELADGEPVAHAFVPSAVIALGCVIRGETEHFRLVADNTAQGLVRVSLETCIPVLNGVLAVENVAQAEARSGGEHGNTGSQVALAAIRCVNQLNGRHA